MQEDDANFADENHKKKTRKKTHNRPAEVLKVTKFSMVARTVHDDIHVIYLHRNKTGQGIK